jgi:hypothetical protein
MDNNQGSTSPQFIGFKKLTLVTLDEGFDFLLNWLPESLGVLSIHIGLGSRVLFYQKRNKLIYKSLQYEILAEGG